MANAAIQDPALSQVPGAEVTGIGISPTVQYGPNAPAELGWVEGDLAYQHRIGEASGTPSERILVEGTSRNLRFSKAAADVAADGVVFTGYLNKTGKTLPTGYYCWAQQAP